MLEDQVVRFFRTSTHHSITVPKLMAKSALISFLRGIPESRTPDLVLIEPASDFAILSCLCRAVERTTLLPM